jgi:hypothetical protein
MIMSNNIVKNTSIIENFGKYDRFLATPFLCHERVRLYGQSNILASVDRPLSLSSQLEQWPSAGIPAGRSVFYLDWALYTFTQLFNRLHHTAPHVHTQKRQRLQSQRQLTDQPRELVIPAYGR